MVVAQERRAGALSGCGMKGWAGREGAHSHLNGCVGAWPSRLTPASMLAAETHLPPDHRAARTVADRFGRSRKHHLGVCVLLSLAHSGDLPAACCKWADVSQLLMLCNVALLPLHLLHNETRAYLFTCRPYRQCMHSCLLVKFIF